MPVVSGTPVDLVQLPGGPVLVKREDKSCPLPGPEFSKVRGVAAHLKGRRELFIGTLDTFHSKAGWGVTYLCRDVRKRSVVFYPVYAGETGLRENQKRARDLGARLVPLKAGRSAILYHQAKAMLLERFPGSYMMPNALKLHESVHATATEVATVEPLLLRDSTWVVSVSSGTIAAGVVRGLLDNGAEGVTVILHMGYSRPASAVLRYVATSAGMSAADASRVALRIVDEGYGYKDAVEVETPFPCNEHYDAKAWVWLTKNRATLGDRVLFWNIGA